MYQTFFKLSEMPFTLTPNTQFFFNQNSHRVALNTMLVALRHSEGFIKIVGEVGTGKTLLCRKLLSLLRPDFITAYIPNPYLSPDELKSLFAEELGIVVDPGLPSYKLLGIIYRRLVQIAKAGKQVVLVIDEAQAMPWETIESLRLLTNLETEKRKLLQVVLLGQPELDTALARRDLRQLKQRIVFSETLYPLSHKQVAEYIKYRIASAGSSDSLFTGGACWLIALASGGIPRLVNILSHKSLMSAYGKGKTKADLVSAARAVRDTAESRWLGKLAAQQSRLFWPAMSVLGTANLGLALLGFTVLGLAQFTLERLS